jgi:hypothetical protein
MGTREQHGGAGLTSLCSGVNLFSWSIFEAPNISPVVEVPVLLVLDLDVVQVWLPRSLPKIDAKTFTMILLFCPQR